MWRQDHCRVDIGWRTDDVYTIIICTTDTENARIQGCIPKKLKRNYRACRAIPKKLERNYRACRAVDSVGYGR